MEWAHKNGFSLPLSGLVIYDSFIHSGQTLRSNRSRFDENVPAWGGSERTRTAAYIDARHRWLANHANGTPVYPA